MATMKSWTRVQRVSKEDGSKTQTYCGLKREWNLKQQRQKYKEDKTWNVKGENADNFIKKSGGKGKEKENSMRKVNQCVSLEMERIIFVERLDLT